MTQKPSQNVEDFICEMQIKGLKAKTTEEQLRFSIINGLRPEIRSAVLQHPTTTIDEIRRWASVAESSQTGTHDDGIAGAVRRLEMKFDTLCTQGVQENRAAREASPRV